MNESFPCPPSTKPPELQSHDAPADEQAQIWEQVLAHSINGLVGLIAVRDEAGQITDFRYHFINQTALRDTFPNRPKDTYDITGKRLTEFFPSIRETAVWQTYLSVVETGQPQRVEQQYDSNAQDRWVSQSVSSFGQDGLLLCYTETSELHVAARRVARQSAVLNGVLNSSPNGIIVYEAIRDSERVLIDFQATLVNQMFEKMTGLESPYFISHTLFRICPPSKKWIGQMQELIETGKPVDINEFIPGLGRWFNITLTRLNDGFVATVKDITMEKQVRQQLEDTVQALHHSNQNLAQFAYVASHDLQEPLRKIVSFGDVLTQHFAGELSDPAADLVHRMQRSAGRMRSLVQDLLTYSRLSGDAKEFRPVNLNQLVALVADDLEITIEDQHATLQIDSLPVVWGDPALLRQLFQNLISNALKFHGPAGNSKNAHPHIIIQGHETTVHELPEDTFITDASNLDNRYAVVNIIDNGIGFDERYLDRIFTIFQRLHGQMHFSRNRYGAGHLQESSRSA